MQCVPHCAAVNSLVDCMVTFIDATSERLRNSYVDVQLLHVTLASRVLQG